MIRAVNAVRSLLATVAIVVIAFGVPSVLIRTIGNPWPGMAAIDLRDEVALVSGVIASIAWVIWARLSMLLGVELVRQLRWILEVRAVNRRDAPGTRPGAVEPIRAPSPGLGALAQRLIATALIVIPLLTRSPTPADATPPLPVMAPANPLLELHREDAVGDTTEGRIDEVRPAVDEASRYHDITVAPNETLRSLARDHLGDAGRWRELFDLNVDRRQIDGRTLTSPSALRVGWQLRVPGNAPAPVHAVRASAVPAQRTPDVRRYTTVLGDGPWHVAEALVGDGVRWHEVLEANEGVEVAPGVVWTDDREVVHPGWTFQWQDPSLRGAVPIETAAPSAEVTVRAGDSLWSLAEARLGGSVSTTVARTSEYVTSIHEANRDVIVDPDLIYPGERIVLPSIDARTDRTPGAGDREQRRGERERAGDDHGGANGKDRLRSDDRPEQRRRDGGDDQRRRRGAPERGERPRPERREDDTPTDDLPATSPPTTHDPGSSVEVASTTRSTERPLIAGDASTDDARPSVAPVGLGAGAMAVGVLAVLEARRRRRLRAASVMARLPVRPFRAVETERTLRRIEGAERQARLDIALRSAASSLLSNGTHRRIAAVIADETGSVTVIADGPVSMEPPWRSERDATPRWELPPAVALEALAATARQVSAPCAALAPIGVTASGADVYVDLECAGVLAVHGEPEQADSIVSGIAAGLAGSLFAESVQLIGIGLPASAFLAHPNHHDVDTIDGAIELAADVLGSDRPAALDSFSARARHTGGESWDPAVLFVSSSHANELDREPAPPSVPIVVAGACTSSVSTVVHLRPGADAWCLDPLGLELTPIGLAPIDLDKLDELLMAEFEEMDPSVPDVDDGPDAADDRDAERAVDDEWDLLVRVIGLVDIVDRDGVAGEFTKSKSQELVAWAATHRDRSTRQGARAALWDVDVRDATFANVVSEARRAMSCLREPATGDQWLARTMNATLRLSDRVVTDADLLAQRLAVSRRQTGAAAIASLRSAAELIRGVPFAESGYLWPDAEGITSQLVVLATSCCTELAQLLLEAEDIEGVFWATGQGLKVLPGHEELIGLRMRAHARKGDRAGVRQEWEAYERVVLADPWSDGEPAPALVRLRHELAPASTAGD